MTDYIKSKLIFFKNKILEKIRNIFKNNINKSKEIHLDVDKDPDWGWFVEI